MKIKRLVAVITIATAMSIPAVAVALPVSSSRPVNELNSYVSSQSSVLKYYEQTHKPKPVPKPQQKPVVATTNKVTNVPKKVVTTTPTITDGSLRLSITNDSYNTMINKINQFFEGSPMAGHGVDFVKAGIKNNIDPYFLAAITMQESSGGLYVGASNNAWGRKALSGGWMSFPSWTSGIYNEAQYLSTNYLDEGLNSINSISYKYCPSPREEWVNGVTGFQQRIANL